MNDILRKLKRYINSPSPIAISIKNRFIYRYGERNIIYFPIEFLLLIRWIISRLIKYIYFLFDYNIDRKFLIFSCIINSFELKELEIYSRFNIKTWEELKNFKPYKMVKYINKEERKYWSNNCKEGINLLNNKSSLYKISPNKWKPYHIVLNNSKEKQKDVFLNQFYKNKILPYLKVTGLILKPDNGSKSKDIILYRLFDNKLFASNLFCNSAGTKYKYLNINYKDLNALYSHWQKTTKNKTNAILMPYIKNDYSLAWSSPSAVIRVITQKKLSNIEIKVDNCWIEICLDKKIYFIDYFSKKFFNINSNKINNISHQYIIDKWTNQEKEPNCRNVNIKSCLNASIEMHSRLPEINKVAWDWIPTKNEPILLEGNPNFNILIPQILDLLNKK